MLWILILIIKVELYSGKSLDLFNYLYRNDTLFTDDTFFTRNEVKSIKFTVKKYETAIKADSNIYNLLRLAKDGRKKYPNAPAIVLEDKMTAILKPDGKRIYKIHYSGLILKQEKRKWGTKTIWYDEEESRVKILLARTIKPDGRILSLKPEDIKVITPYRGIVYYGKSKALSFSLPEVEVGDIIEYKYEYEVFNPWYKEEFSPEWFFGGTTPVLFSQIEIKIPKDKNLYYTLIKAKNVEIESTFTDSYKIYKFSMRDVEPVIEEPNMPPIAIFIPRLSTSINKTWDKIFDWYSKFQKNRMIITDEIKNLVDSLINGLQTEEAKIAKLYHWVQRNIRYISIKGAAASGVSGHRADETLKNGYGDCTDKAILFSTMLRAAGIEAYPVYVTTNDEDTTIVSMPSFTGNHAIVEVFLKDGRNIFLDPTGRNSRYPHYADMDQGVWAINAQKRKISLTPVLKPEQNLREYNYDLKLVKDTLYVDFYAKYNGDYECWLRYYWQSVKPAEYEMRFKEMVKAESPDAELISYKIENLWNLDKPFALRMKYKIANYIQKTGKIGVFSFPEIKRRYSFSEVNLVDRKYPLMYPSSQGIRHCFKLLLPKNLKVEYLPEEIKEKIGFAGFNGKVYLKGDTLIYEDYYYREGQRVGVKDYPAFREFIQKIRNWVSKPIIFVYREEL